MTPSFGSLLIGEQHQVAEAASRLVGSILGGLPVLVLVALTQEEHMSNDKQDPLSKPVPQPIEVIQFEDGYIEIFEKNMIGFGSGKAPEAAKQN